MFFKAHIMKKLLAIFFLVLSFSPIGNAQKQQVTNQPDRVNSETTIEEPAIEILYEDVLEKIRIAFASRSKIDLDEAQKSFNNFKKVF